MIRQDKKGVLKFAPLQSAAGQKELKTFGLSQKDLQTFLLIQNGKVYQQSSAALQVARYFSWYWQWVQVLWLVPRPVRDAVYRFVVPNRYRWFGKKDACMVPSPHLLQRFLISDKGQNTATS